MNNQRANFQLKTTEGVLTGYNNSCTWNVDISKILGDMYDQYEYFNLTLKCIAFDIVPAGTTSPNVATTLNNFYMKGLNWENCNYDSVTNQLRDRTCIASMYFYNYISLTSSTINNTPTNMVNTFKKSTNIVDLNISIFDGTNSNTLGSFGGGNAMFPQAIYDFTIIPCKDYKDTRVLLTLYDPVLTNSGTTSTFKNINFELVLGKLWNKYGRFSVELVDVKGGNTAGLTLNGSSTVCNVELLGLRSIDNHSSVIFSGPLIDLTRITLQYNWTALSWYNDEIDTSNIVEIDNKTDIVISFKSIETNNNIAFTSGSLRKNIYHLLIKPIT